MKGYFISILFLVVVLSCTSKHKEKKNSEHYPTKVLTNNVLTAHVLIPNAEHGYYRSTRFDWSGIIAQVEYQGHTYFQEWQDYNGTITPGKHDPLNAGTATGTAEEFRDPQGFTEARAGEPFLKIGVGVLEKANDSAYHWDYPYKFIEKGQWDIETTKNSIRFTQKFTTTFGYAYHYEKNIVLVENKPEIKINHCLKNIGTKDMFINPYCHNFFMFDNQPINTDYRIEFPKPITLIKGFDSRVTIQENQLKLNESLSDDDWTGGHIDPGLTKEYVLSNNKTKTAVKVISDVNHGPFYIHLTEQSFCPEPMVEFSIKPNEESKWTRVYQFIK